MIQIFDSELDQCLYDINNIREKIVDSGSSVLSGNFVKLDICGYLLVAFFVADGQRVAYCGLRKSLIRNVDKPIELDIFVMPKFQHKQIGTRLIKQTAMLATSDYSHLTIEVKHSSELVPFYKQLGFQVYYVWQTETVMVYPL
ncbi:TPA: GNAT family N-acetyltransferase [Vibrio diabolicus]